MRRREESLYMNGEIKMKNWRKEKHVTYVLLRCHAKNLFVCAKKSFESTENLFCENWELFCFSLQILQNIFDQLLVYTFSLKTL